MRNLKKLFAVILTVAMIASLMVPALAATQNTEKALKLQAINVMAGTVDDLKLDEDLTRIQALTFAIRAAGKDAEALALTAEEIEEIFEGWVDVNDVADWQKPYIAYAIKEKITAGVGGGRFASMDRADGPQLLRFLLIAGMGYAPEDVTTVNAVELAIKYGILTANEATLFANDYYLIRDEAVVILYGAFMNGVNADGTKLIDAYIASGATTAAAAAEAGFVEANTMVAEATKVNVIKVTFASAVDKADIKFAVTRDGINVATEAPEWDGSTVATVKTAAKMTAGKYTITATSASDADFEVKASFEIKADEVNIVISNAVALTGKGTGTGAKDGELAYVYYDVLDQYGESIRSSTSIQWSASTGSENLNDNRAKGLLTISRSDGKAFTYGEKIYITGVYARTGSSVQAEVSVGMPQALDKVEFAGFLKKGTTDILKTLPAGFKAEAYYLLYNAQDQNGNPIDYVDKPIDDGEVTFISENVMLIEKIKDGERKIVVGGEEYYAVQVWPGMSVDQGGEATITAIANKTGNKSSLNVAVGENQILQSFTMEYPTGLIIDNEDVEIPFTAYDQNGNEIKNFVTLANQTQFNNLTFNASPGSLILSENDDGTATLKYDDPGVAWDKAESTDGIDRIASLTSIVVGGGTSNLTLRIQDRARPVGIKDIKIADVLVEGGSTTVELDGDNDTECFTFVDQYGREMSEEDAYTFFKASEDDKLNGLEFEDYVFSIRMTYLGDNGYFNGLTKDLQIEISADDSFTVTADPITANDVKTAKPGFPFKFEIVKYKAHAADAENFEDDAQQVSPAKNFEVTIIDISAVRSFSIDDINKFFVSTAKTKFETGQLGGLDKNTVVENITGATVETEREVAVKGTYNGKNVDIPAKYLEVSADKFIFDGNKAIDVSTAAIKWSDLYDVKTANFLRKDASDTVKVKVMGETGETLDTLSKGIKFSDENRAIDSVTAKDAVTLAPSKTKITINLANVEEDIDLKAKDQYGDDFDLSGATFKVASVVANADGYAENNFKVSKNDSEEVEIEGAERGDTFTLTVTVGGKSVDVKVTVGADSESNITDGVNNYRDVLVKTVLEQQRKDGLQ